MSEQKTVNARITATMLGIEDHGIMTFYLTIEWPGAGQGAGGFCIDGYDQATDSRVGFGPGITAIRRILETVGVEKWEDLKGKLIRAKVESAGSSRTPIIGHILEDKWFDMKAFFENAKK